VGCARSSALDPSYTALPLTKNHDPVGDRGNRAENLVHDDRGDPGFLDRPDDSPDLARDQRREAFGRFIEDEQLRMGQSAPADGEHLLLTSGELASAVIQALCQPGKVSRTRSRVQSRAPCAPGRGRHHQIFAAPTDWGICPAPRARRRFPRARSGGARVRHVPALHADRHPALCRTGGAPARACFSGASSCPCRFCPSGPRFRRARPRSPDSVQDVAHSVVGVDSACLHEKSSFIRHRPIPVRFLNRAAGANLPGSPRLEHHATHHHS